MQQRFFVKSVVWGALAALSFGLAPAAWADTTLVIPGQAATTEGGGNSTLVFNDTVAHYQFQYGASLFAPGPITIEGVQFRYDEQVTDQFATTTSFAFDSTLKVVMATAAHPIDQRSTTFADDLGADATTVLTGPDTVVTQIDGHAGQTKGFGITFDFTTPFTYDPSQGDLVLDMFLPKSTQFADVDEAGGANLEIMSALDDGPTGQQGGGADVVQFILGDPSGVTSGGVPEPASWALMIVGFGLAGATLRLRRGSVSL